MARIASTTTNGVSSAPPMTLDALMQRQKEIALRQRASAAAPRDMQSPWQGAAYLADILGDKLEAGRVDKQLAQGREQFAQIMGGVDWAGGGGPTGEQAAQMMQIDPQAGMQLYQSLAELAAQRRARELEIADRTENRTYEQGDQIADEARATEAQIAKENRTKAQYRPMTPEDYTQWGIAVDPDTGVPTQPYRFNATENKPEAISTGGGGANVLPAEIGARIGMADVFTERYPQIIADIESGEVTGLRDYAQGKAGIGRVGEVHRQIKSGIDALVRNLTGAGKSESEARDYASRYEPQLLDSVGTLKSKIVGLQEELTGVRDSVTYGRNAPEAPQPAPEAPPAPVGAPDATPTPGGAPAPPAPPVSQYETGKTYTFDEGVFTYLGGDPTVATSWKPASAGGP